MLQCWSAAAAAAVRRVWQACMCELWRVCMAPGCVPGPAVPAGAVLGGACVWLERVRV